MADKTIEVPQKTYEVVMRERMFRDQESIRGTFGISTRNMFDDMAFIDRMIKFYKKAHQLNPDAGDSMWSLFLNDHNRQVHELVLAGNIEAVAKIWRDPAETQVFYGFEGDMLGGNKSSVTGSDLAMQLHAARSYDGLRRLAEAVGSLRLEHIESAYQDRPEAPEVEPLIELLDRGIGMPISFPNPYPNEFGLSTSRGVVGYRTIQALYEAWRVREELTNMRGTRVVEIGAGLGRSIYHALQLGITSYTAVDIPFTALSQAHFLAATIGPGNIALFGEEDQNRPVKIIPPAAFFESSERYDVAVNFDSLTELDGHMARRYVREITQRCAVFLSANHEFNPIRVCELFAKDPARWSRISRSPYWMRKSYVEELFGASPHKYEADLLAMQNSSSWKLTAPLRKVAEALRALKQR